MRTLIVGTGKMGTALARGLVETGTMQSTDLFGVDPSPEARTAFVEATGAQASGPDPAVLGTAEVLLLAVKPQIAAGVARDIGGALGEPLILSIAAGIRLRSLSEWFDSSRVVRVMPNTPMQIGRGASAFACAAGVTEADRGLIERILESVGVAREVPEDQMDAVTALSGSGPAYVFEVIEGMTRAAEALGLRREDALELAAHTVRGAAEMVVSACGEPEELRNAVTSKGGTTAEGLRVLAERDLRGILQDALGAAKRRSVELGGGG